MALQKVDAVIAGVGAFALIATALGVLLYDDLAGERDITFPTTTRTLDAQQGVGAPLQFTLPQNATSASLDVLVRFTGQAGQGGTAQITIDVTGPDGLSRQATGTLAIAAGATSAETTVDVPDLAWAQVPEARSGDPAAVDETRTWDEPLTVTVTVDAPADNLGAIPGGAVNYNFQATVTPTVTVYSEAVQQPDVETA